VRVCKVALASTSMAKSICSNGCEARPHLQFLPSYEASIHRLMLDSSVWLKT